MISGHLRFSFFSRCGTFVQRRSKENEIQAPSQQSPACRKLLFRHAEFNLSFPKSNTGIQCIEVQSAEVYLRRVCPFFMPRRVTCDSSALHSCDRRAVTNKKRYGGFMVAFFSANAYN